MVSIDQCLQLFPRVEIHGTFSAKRVSRHHVDHRSDVRLGTGDELFDDGG